MTHMNKSSSTSLSQLETLLKPHQEKGLAEIQSRIREELEQVQEESCSNDDSGDDDESSQSRA